MSNLQLLSRCALIDLVIDKSIVISKADKGQQIVILNQIDYKRKVQELLSNQTQYRRFYYNPLERDQSILKGLCNQLQVELNMSHQFFQQFLKHTPRSPSYYCLPKIHKTGIPLRPIVSCIRSCDYYLCKYLSGLLYPVVASNPHLIVNIANFVDFIKQAKLQENEIMVNLDVVSMFSNIPAKEAIDIVVRQLKARPYILRETPLSIDQIQKLLVHTSTTVYFHFQGNFYEQVRGLPMGKPTSPAISNIYMQKFEEEFFKDYPDFVRVWKRYLNDIFIIIDKSKFDDFFDKLNRFDSNIKFSHELEQNGRLNILDMTLFRTKDNRINTKVYRRCGSSNYRTIDFDSYQAVHIKKALVKSLFQKYNKWCSTQIDLNEEKSYLHNLLIKNNYPKKFVNTQETQVDNANKSNKIKRKKQKKSGRV
eukprot:TRINITY_DN6132_c0_g1_i5.p1 TRINITY_DN6132_c0_g1~~TRINITY_DN6132_c0_g1_i5.p1  ORF type:complete len:422 (+),score=0.51 TRINITY_DN6132_c0_g1_i5:431-1696(+)